MMNFNLVFKKAIVAGLTVATTLSMVACGQQSAGTAQIEDEQVATTGAIFSEGVYVNYAAEAENPEKTYFYVFKADGSGSIEDGAVGTGNFFEYEQGEDTVTFHIGSIDPIDEVFTVKSNENGVVTGSFDDGIELVFEPVTDVDVDTFDAVNYVNAANGAPAVYTDANGWRVKYNADLIQVNQGGPVTTFVYTGDCAGTCMITATYTVENGGEAAVKEIGESWGDKTTFSESIFPGTEDVKGYWAVLPSGEEGGTGLNMTAMGRDYMDGALVFEFTVHNGDDELMNMAVSDELAGIIDSLEFINE